MEKQGHTWCSVRYIDENDVIYDIVSCSKCGASEVWTNVKINDAIPRLARTESECEDRVIDQVLST